MKVGPLFHALRKTDWCLPLLIHTGQHFDHNMSGAFFEEFSLPEPDHYLGIGAGTHAEQTAGVMLAYEKVCENSRPDWVVVAGDVNSTLACSLVAAKLLIPVAHLEAGLRSGDRTMPEEINRIVTDAVSSLLWTPSPDGDENLLREGVAPGKIERIGNIMIDSFENQRAKIASLAQAAKMGFLPGEYGIITLHRPSNVDHEYSLRRIVEILASVAQNLPIILPLHPRTKARLVEFGLIEEVRGTANLTLIDPQPYNAFMSLVTTAKLVITDSGGLQEETTYLGIPCLTLRDNTERPITISQGTNRLVNLDDLAKAVAAVLSGKTIKANRPDLWDGKTADRAVESLRRHSGRA